MNLVDFNPESDRIVTAKSGRPRGFIDWKPRAASQKLLTQIDTVLAEYVDHLPLTARQVFYRLVGAYDFPKLEKDYKRLQEALVRARRAQATLGDAESVDEQGAVGLARCVVVEVGEQCTSLAAR